MNQLLSKNIKTSLLVFVVGLFLYGFKPSFYNDVNDSFLSLCIESDAYYEYYFNDVSYTKNWSRYNRDVTIKNKLVLNTKKGVENYAFLNLTEYQSNHIKSFKIRTLKSDGTIIELDSSLVFKRKSKKEKFGSINYPIPAVEPGDTIETNYVYSERLKASELMNYVNLYAELPSLKSQYTLRASSSELIVRYKGYNDFPEPKVVANDSIVYAQFAMDSVKGYTQSEFSCLLCEKPYLYYTFERKESDLRTWKDVYNGEFNIVSQPMSLDYDKSSYYKRWKRRIIGAAKDSSKYYKFNLLHSEVLNNFKIEPVKSAEIIKSSGYFLKKKRFDPISIRRFYRQVLEDLDIDYWAVFAKSKRLGSIDKYYIRKGEFDHVFFAMQDKKGVLKFLYPHSEYYRYQINEIPTDIYNTEGVLVKPILEKKLRKRDKFISRDLQLAEVDSVSAITINLPGMDASNNYIQQIVLGKVDVQNKETKIRYRFKTSGGLSTDLRSFYRMLGQNKEASDFYDALSKFEGVDNTIEVDTVMKSNQDAKRPFVYKAMGEGTLNNVITFINENLVSISMDKLISHNQLENSSNGSDLNYYLDYSYSDDLMYFLDFPAEIEVLGLEDKSINFKSEFGEYKFKLKQNKNNQVLISSKYAVLKDRIPKEKLSEVELLNEQVKKAKNRKLIIKLK
ncbi:protein of unknown function [Tenacibaculum sp. MAR_2009_124]|uniref:DUF3857 domain-containing protein n=1 Tax=Tenacibaculum sp. MAR_2009_124 TaxID=1250059 RepID=UPI0008964AB8|nr:DUF3857 domain-containing protein [Tenacibaculum sp. MAR_2009_124]SEC20662.1 protein of unknown function [Tenacibaculum sp. MAR_2009_124]